MSGMFNHRRQARRRHIRSNSEYTVDARHARYGSDRRHIRLECMQSRGTRGRVAIDANRDGQVCCSAIGKVVINHGRHRPSFVVRWQNVG